jgi:FkbM family methyltransferase
MLSILKQLFPFKFKRNIKDSLGVPSLHWSLLNLKKLGFVPVAAADIGAYEGEWTSQFLEIFPNTPVIMVEPQLSKLNKLNEFAKQNPSVLFKSSLLSATEAAVLHFNEDETASHVTNVATTEIANTKISTTLDNLIASSNFLQPNYIKLDVQGYELEVLRGAKNSLQSCEVCQLEVSVMNLGDDSPLFLEVSNFMSEQGFQLYDITQFMRRPYDKALHQLDVIFVRTNSRLLSEKRWN